jgi:hypothetical protein
MAKRLTDTDKWNDDWYISLSNDYRIIWQWLLDNCNHAGICKRSIRIMNLMCNTNVTEEELITIMDGRLYVKGNIWFIPKFLKFQYTTLKSGKPVIISVLKELEKHELTSMIIESFGNDYLIIKDKDKDKDKNLVKLKKSKNEKFSGNFKAQGEELFASRSDRRRKLDTEGEDDS